jgi:hypothetical protein
VTGAGAGVTPNDALIVSRAWGLWKASDSLVFKVGRFGLEVADGAVLAENDYEAIPTQHEGLAAIWDTSFAGFAFVSLKTAELGTLPTGSVGSGVAGTGNPSSDPELNIYGIVADIKNMPEAVKVANVHVLQVNKDETLANTGNFDKGAMNAQLIGLTVGGDVSNVLYKVTAAMQTGIWSKTAAAEQKLSASMYDLMVGYKMPEVMGLKITAGYHMDSGDDNTTADKNEGYWAPFYDKHNYAGLMDVVRWGNLTYMNVNASMNPMEDLEVGAGYYMFSRTSDKAGASFSSDARYTGLAVGGNDKAIGSELDLYGNKSYEGGALKVGARLGMFMPGEGMKNATTKQEKTLMQAMLQASLAF